MKPDAGRRGGGGQRLLRVGEELRHALAEIVQRGELRDPVLSGRSITITEVRVTPDLKSAIVFMTPLGGADGDAILAALGRAAPFLRGRVATAVRLKFAPSLSFRVDQRFAAAGRIETLLQSEPVQRDLNAPADPASPDLSNQGADPAEPR